MAPRKKKIQLFALNLTTHPHPKGVYTELLRTASRRKVVGRMRGERSALLLSVAKSGSHPDFLRGSIGTFTGIDRNHRWLNLETSEPADEEELSRVVVPSHLQPNFQQYDYIFHEASHYMIVREELGGGPQSIARALHNILNHPRMDRAGSPVRVQVEQDHETLAGIFRAYVLSLEIRLELPNPDDLDSARRRVYEQMAKRKVKKLKETMSGEGIEADDELRDRARVALSDGEVKARVREGQGPAHDVATKDHPMRHVDTLDAAEDDDRGFWRTALDFLDKLRK